MKRIDNLSQGCRGAALAILLASGAGLGGTAAATPDAPPLVRTQDGPVQGVARDGVHVFSAIPFAAPPVGPLRFRPPQPVAKWTEPLVATKEIPNCIQFGGMNKAPQSEDCLYLSVFAPDTATPAKPLPVMVWVFGGGLTESGPRGYDGTKLAVNNGVIVVTINYRLGLFATMNDASLDEGAVKSGNYALKDEQAALRWVQRNIAPFGGDPKNVTLFGQSAGASTILMQLASPAAKGLFQKAIMQSSGKGAALAKRDPAASAKAIKAVGCADKPDVAACLRAAPVSAFVNSKASMKLVYGDDFMPLDLPEAFKAGRFNRVPVINGNNLNEALAWVQPIERELGHPLTQADLPAAAKELFGADAETLLAAYPASKYPTPDIALMNATTDSRQSCFTDTFRRSMSNYVPIYGYEVSEPNPAQQAPDPKITNIPNTPRHGTENAYIFGRNAAQSSRAAALSARFQRYWTNFAKFGTPDPTGMEWPRFTIQTHTVISIEEPPNLSANFAERHNCAFMLAKGIVR